MSLSNNFHNFSRILHNFFWTPKDFQALKAIFKILMTFPGFPWQRGCLVKGEVCFKTSCKTREKYHSNTGNSWRCETRGSVSAMYLMAMPQVLCNSRTTMEDWVLFWTGNCTPKAFKWCPSLMPPSENNLFLNSHLVDYTFLIVITIKMSRFVI